MSNSESRTKSYEIIVYLKDADDDDLWPWVWIIDDVRSIRKYSRRLAENLGEDGASRVECNDEWEAEALATIIQRIPGKGHRRPSRLATNNPDHGFSNLLYLAAALWKFNCSLPRSFDEHAQIVFGIYHPEILGISQAAIWPQASVHWMFIALVFGWEAVFRNMSVDVVVRNDPLRDDQELRALPKDFRGTQLPKSDPWKG